MACSSDDTRSIIVINYPLSSFVPSQFQPPVHANAPRSRGHHPWRALAWVAKPKLLWLSRFFVAVGVAVRVGFRNRMNRRWWGHFVVVVVVVMQ